MARSGQITVAAAGTAQRGSSVEGVMFAFAAHPDNTGAAWVGEVSGDVSSSNGFPLAAGGAPVIVEASNLDQFYFDVTTSGDKVCWIRLR